MEDQVKTPKKQAQKYRNAHWVVMKTGREVSVHKQLEGMPQPTSRTIRKTHVVENTKRDTRVLRRGQKQEYRQSGQPNSGFQ